MSWPILLAVKPIVYFGVMDLCTRRWAAKSRHKELRVILGGLARLILGAVVGIPVGLGLRGYFDDGHGAAFYAIFFALRFALWLLVLRIAFLKAPFREVAAAAAASTLINAALDLALPESLMDAFYINFC